MNSFQSIFVATSKALQFETKAAKSKGVERDYTNPTIFFFFPLNLNHTDLAKRRISSILDF